MKEYYFLTGFFFLQTEKEDSRTVQDIRTRHVKGGIIGKFVGLRIRFVVATKRKLKTEGYQRQRYTWKKCEEVYMVPLAKV